MHNTKHIMHTLRNTSNTLQNGCLFCSCPFPKGAINSVNIGALAFSLRQVSSGYCRGRLRRNIRCGAEATGELMANCLRGGKKHKVHFDPVVSMSSAGYKKGLKKTLQWLSFSPAFWIAFSIAVSLSDTLLKR